MRASVASVSAESAGSRRADERRALRPPSSARAEIADHLSRPAALRAGLAEKRLRGGFFAAEATTASAWRARLGGRSSSSSSTALSASAHCRSSMQMTSGWRSRDPGEQLAQRVEGAPPQDERIGDRRAAAPGTRSRSPAPAAAPGTLASTPPRRAAAARSTSLAGIAMRDGGSGSSTTPSSALYGTDSFS